MIACSIMRQVFVPKMNSQINGGKELKSRESEIMLYNLMRDESAVKPAIPQPRNELSKLVREGRRIIGILRSYYDAVNEVVFFYVFDESEESRTGLIGECNTYGGLGSGIGISESIIFGDDSMLRFVIIHELSHLRFIGHDKEFHAFLDELISYYNKQTGENLINDYEPFCRIRNDGRKRGY